jgi:transposase
MGSVGDRAMHQDRHEDGGYRRIELITGVRRRRQWTAAEKAALVAESFQLGINVSELARRHGVNRGLLQSWRRAAMREATEDAMRFIPLRVEEAPAPAGTAALPRDASTEKAVGSSATEAGTIEIERGDMRVRFSGPVDVAALRVVLGRVGRRA